MLTHTSEQLTSTDTCTCTCTSTYKQLTPDDIECIKKKLIECYKKIYDRTWKTFTQVPNLPEGDNKKYNHMEIPEGSKYHKKTPKPEDFKPTIFTTVLKNGNKINACVFTKGPLSNWYPALISYEYDKKSYKLMSTEQMFIIHKSKYLNNDYHEVNDNILEDIEKTPCPLLVQKYGRKLNINITEWNINSAQHLEDSIVAKFEQNPDFMEFLRILYENGIYDIFEGQPDQLYGIGLDFDPSIPDHLDATNWPGQMKLTTIYKNVMTRLFKTKLMDESHESTMD